MSFQSNQPNERSRLLRISTSRGRSPTWTQYLLNWVDYILAGRDEDDDAVSLGMKRLAVAITISISLWLVSFLLVMMEVIQQGKFIRANVLLFLPMWLGSLVGMTAATVITVTVCKNATLVSRERRLFMRAQGAEVGSQFIDYDSLPLMRRLFCWNLIMFITYLLILITQVLYSLWFVHGIIGVWHALVPSLMLLSIYLIYLYLINVFSPIMCGVYTLLLIEMVLFTLKCSGRLSSTNWTMITIPLIAVQLISYWFAGDTVLKIFANKIVPSKLQLFCLLSYILALLLSTAAELDTIIEVACWSASTADVEDNMVSMRPAILWTTTLMILAICSMLIMNVEVNSLAERRGFMEPQPLSRTAEGWEPTPSAGLQFYPLLGYVRLNRASGRTIGRATLFSPSVEANAASAAASLTQQVHQRKADQPTVSVRNPTTFPQLESNFEIEMPQRRYSPA